MYLAVQRVRAADGRTGVNAYLYLHGTSDLEWVDWSRTTGAELARQAPGTLATEQLELPPGENAVLSYLDVWSLSSGEEAISEVLAQAVRAAGSAKTGEIRGPGVIARFDAAPSIPTPAAELAALAGRARDVAAGRGERAWAPGEGPLVVIRRRVGDAFVFELTEASASKLRGRTPEFRAPRVHVGPERLDELRQHSPLDLSTALVPVLTGLSLLETLPLGGVRFTTEAAELLWEWPVQKGIGYCQRCHHHGTLQPVRGAFRRYRCVSCGTEQDGDGLWVATLG